MSESFDLQNYLIQGVERVVCEAVKAVLTGGEFSYDGLTGEGMTWDASGAVSKAPRGMIIENGEYVGLD